MIYLALYCHHMLLHINVPFAIVTKLNFTAEVSKFYAKSRRPFWMILRELFRNHCWLRTLTKQLPNVQVSTVAVNGHVSSSARASELRYAVDYVRPIRDQHSKCHNLSATKHSSTYISVVLKKIYLFVFNDTFEHNSGVVGFFKL